MKILLLDLETSPLKGWAWEKYDTNIIEVIDPCRIMVIGWNWYDSEKIWTQGGHDTPELDLVNRLWGLLDDADVVVAHNGDKFDLRVSNARFLHYGLKPPSPYKTVDTLKIARKHFRLESNKLTDLGRYLGVGEKISTGGWDLWKACLAGDKSAFARMREYNARDVELLKDVYAVLRPWSPVHPNADVFNRVKPQCPNEACSSHNVQRRGTSVLKERVKQRFQCQDCGTWFKGDYLRKDEML